MNWHPILFSGWKVRRILEWDFAAQGDMQTRRVIKPQPSRLGLTYCAPTPLREEPYWFDAGPAPAGRSYRCPYGVAGDKLWTREAITRSGGYLQYVADRCTTKILWPADWRRDSRPSIHMPRWASRLPLAVRAVRVERVQEIGEAAAAAEGCCTGWAEHPMTNTEKFRRLWDSLNAKRGFGWEANPFVWIVEFRRDD